MLLTNKKTSAVIQRIQTDVECALKDRQISARRASIDVVGHDGLIRDIRAGRVPSVDRLEALFDYLGLEFYFGPLRQLQAPSANLTFPSGHSPTFSKTKTIPLRGFASCSVQGWGKPQPAEVEVAMPEGLTDPDAFYVRAHGQSMIPEGITAGALCLVSPNTEPQENDRVWIKEHGGNTSIKRLVSIADDTLILRGWLPTADSQQKSFNEERVRKYVDELYPVTAVFSGNPGKQGSGVTFVPDPRRAGHQVSEISDLQNEGEYHLINLHDVQASAGNGTFNDDESVLSSLAFRKQWLGKKGINPANASLIYVAGDSMEPTLVDRSIVLINHQNIEPHKRRMYAFREGSELYIKRLEKPDVNTLIISGDNPSYPSRVLTRHAMNSIHIIGEVVWAARDV